MKPIQANIAGTMQKIVDFHMDESRDWVAELECGHQQHVRHNPPWTHRHWVTTPQGRLEHVGRELNCLACRPADSLRFSIVFACYSSRGTNSEQAGGPLRQIVIRAGQH
jgi:Protein of unknown function (DUF3565)